ncbi:MAG TPA: UvrD-helicase domain-containing protein [Anaeromyxobacter sp.]|nr:UvrD-helicase domain-containing protein [Anaeromyxobacter sp.]
MSPIVFSPAAEALFRLEGPTAVSAGAGSGKTTALVELVVRLLDGRALGTPCAPSELAAITYTDKAAEELRDRVRAAVEEQVRAAGERGAAEERRAWLERLHGLERLAAATIHGFCGRLLREHAPEAGLDPEFEIVEEERARAWLEDAAREAVVAALDEGRPEARVLVGQQRTRELAGWIVSLVRERATRGELGPLATAPGDPAAAEAARRALLAGAERVRRLGAASGAEARAALAEDVGRALDALAPGDRAGPLALEALHRLGALAEAARRHDVRGGELGPAKKELLAAWNDLRGEAADVLAGPQRAELARLVGEAERRYADRKRRARAVDFDDLLLRGRALLAGDAALRAELRGSLRALLVDEYQDVNPVQQDLVDLLARPAPGGAPGPILVAVGDLKQSIYRFRGADVAVFARLVRSFAAGEGRVLHLTENHRSAPAVLDLVNAVSQRTLQPPAGAAPRDDEISFRPEDRLQPRRAEGARPACELLVDEDADGDAEERRLREARAIAARIVELVSGDAGVRVHPRPEGGVAQLPRPPRHGEVALLFRRLTQLGPYERALREAGIPYRLARGGGFYQASEVRDVGELLAALADPEDALAWAALLRSPMCAVSDGALFLLSRVGLARLHGLTPEAIDAELPGELLTAEERARLHRFLDTWRELHAVRDRLPLAELLERAVERLDLDAALLAAPDGERRAANLDKALALAARFAETGGGPAELAAHLRALAARPPREPEAALEDADAVALLTIHQAKGLEWPVVFVPELGAAARNDTRQVLLDATGRLCTALVDPVREELVKTASVDRARQWDRRANDAESRRLLYVALTRARDHLVLSGEGKPQSWRGMVEAAVGGEKELLRTVPYAKAPDSATAAATDTATATATASLLPPVLPGPPPLPAVRLAVTELAEYARCPRRHLLGRVLGIAKPRGDSAPPADDPARATERGTLAHAMLAEADLSAPPLERRTLLAAVATRRGYDPQSPGVRRILFEVLAFAESAAGKRLVQAARDGRLSREVPFLLRLDGAGATAVYLVGALDALVRGPAKDELTVIDYKYATPRPESAERYRLQLAAYALAASRAFPRLRVRATLQFLRGDLRTLDLTPTPAELQRFEELAPRLAQELAARRAPTPEELGRDAARCSAEGCGYVGRCYRGERGPQIP